MKKMRMKKKALVLSLGLVIMMLPARASAQEDSKPGGLFGVSSWFESEGLFQNRGTTEELDLTVNTQDFGQDVPVGSGIAFLIGAGLGYVTLKKKEDEQ